MLKRDLNCGKEITESSNTISWEKDGWGFYGRVVCPNKIKHLKTTVFTGIEVLLCCSAEQFTAQ